MLLVALYAVKANSVAIFVVNFIAIMYVLKVGLDDVEA